MALQSQHPVQRTRCVILLIAGGLMLAQAANADSWQVWITDGEGQHPLRRDTDLRWQTAGLRDLPEVVIDPRERHQEFLGVGAAMTDSAAAVINQRLTGSARRAFLREVFTPGFGLGLDLMRVTIGGSDFSQRHYSLDDTADDSPDPALHHYADAAETIEVRQLMREARSLNAQLRVIASPWSAPAWMKSSGSLIGGHLLKEYQEAFADYLLRFVDGYSAAHVPLYAITVQNEPAYEAKDYASMRFDAQDRADFIAEVLGPRLRARSIRPLLLEWDHNWSMPGSSLSVLARGPAAAYVDGVAWHCYGGTPQTQEWIRAVAPHTDAYITECSSGGWQREWPETFRAMVGTLLIDGIRSGAKAVLLWNLALDEAHGPHVGGCRNCRGLYTLGAHGEVIRHAEFYALAHVARFVRPGAIVIGSASSSEDLRSVAFRHPATGRIVILLQNAAAHPTDFQLRLGARRAALHLEAGSVATVTGSE